MSIRRDTCFNPWIDPPWPGQTHKHIDGVLVEWDNEPPELFGQIWIPVCAWCRRGPLNSGVKTCGEC